MTGRLLLHVTLLGSLAWGVQPFSQARYPSVKVALTRELGKNDKLRYRLRELRPDLDVEELPCIEHCELASGEAVPGLLREQSFDYVVVTSPEAAEVLLRLLETGFGALEAAPPLRLAAVGDATARILESRGLAADFLPSKALGKVLAAELPPTGSNRVLYPASKRAATTIQDGLAARGFEVTRVDTYDTVPAAWTEATAEAAKATSVVTFASPSAVKVWTEQVPGARQMPVACIGETSAKRCEELGYEMVEFPEKPGIEGWAESVIACVERLEAQVDCQRQ